MPYSDGKIQTGVLKQVLIKDIKVPPDRARKDFSEQFSFMESIKEKGLLQPITLSKDLTLLAGERRYRACKELGMEKIPALIRDLGEDEEIDSKECELYENIWRKDFTWQEKVRLIADIDELYKSKNEDWSGRKTAQLVNQSVMNVQRNLELAKAIKVIPELGEQLTASDAHKMLKSLEEKVAVEELLRRQQAAIQTKPEEIKNEAGEVVAYVGGYSPEMQTFLGMADQAYGIGDTLEALKQLPPNGPVNLIECDPPYGINLNALKASKDSADSNVHSYEEIDEKDYPSFLKTLCTELYRVAARDAWCIFWFGPTWFQDVKNELIAAGWHVDDIPGIWVKNQGQTLQPEVYLARYYEPFFLCRKGKPFLNKRGRPNVFTYNGTPASRKYHPTERPIELIVELLSTLGLPRQTVLVPFLGSGATLRAAFQLGQLAFGWDKNPEYKPKFMLAVEEDAKAILAAKPLPLETENA